MTGSASDAGLSVVDYCIKAPELSKGGLVHGVKTSVRIWERADASKAHAPRGCVVICKRREYS